MTASAAALALANFRPVAGVLREFQQGVVHTEPDDREKSHGEFRPRFGVDRTRSNGGGALCADRLGSLAGSSLSDADRDAGCGIRWRPCGLLVSSVSGQRCRWLAPWCQVAICLIWNWCLRFIVMALVRWLLLPLERFLVACRVGLLMWTMAGLTLHLVWQDPFRLLIWGAVAGVALGFWAAWHWPAGRVQA